MESPPRRTRADAPTVVDAVRTDMLS